MQHEIDMKVDRKFFDISSDLNNRDDLDFWLTKTPKERLDAVELMRQVVYGYDPYTERIQRIFEITDKFYQFATPENQ